MRMASHEPLSAVQHKYVDLLTFINGESKLSTRSGSRVARVLTDDCMERVLLGGGTDVKAFNHAERRWLPWPRRTASLRLRLVRVSERQTTTDSHHSQSIPTAAAAATATLSAKDTVTNKEPLHAMQSGDPLTECNCCSPRNWIMIAGLLTQ